MKKILIPRKRLPSRLYPSFLFKKSFAFRIGMRNGRKLRGSIRQEAEGRESSKFSIFLKNGAHRLRVNSIPSFKYFNSKGARRKLRWNISSRRDIFLDVSYRRDPKITSAFLFLFSLSLSLALSREVNAEKQKGWRTVWTGSILNTRSAPHYPV